MFGFKLEGTEERPFPGGGAAAGALFLTLAAQPCAQSRGGEKAMGGKLLSRLWWKGGMWGGAEMACRSVSALTYSPLSLLSLQSVTKLGRDTRPGPRQPCPPLGAATVLPDFTEGRDHRPWPGDTVGSFLRLLLPATARPSHQ